MALANQLGCGAYAAQFFTRGGQTRVGPAVGFTSMSYSRELDAMSTARIEFTGQMLAACCSIIGTIFTWEHELSIYRGGSPVWVGPVTGMGGEGDKWGVSAGDLSAWFRMRRNDTTRSWSNTDQARIFCDIASEAIALDPSPNINLSLSPSGVPGAYIEDGLGKMYDAILNDVANGGVDYTTILRTIMIGGKAIPTATLPQLRDEHIVGQFKPQVDGFSQANDARVLGDQPRDPTNGQFMDGSRWTATARDAAAAARSGLLQTSLQVDGIEDNASCSTAAASIVALRAIAPAIVSDLILDDTAPLTFAQLVPGALVRLATTRSCYPVSGVYRLKTVSVRCDPREEVALTLQPVGTT